MPKQAPPASIRVAEVDGYVCSVFRPPLSSAEAELLRKEAIEKAVIPEPLGEAKVKVGGFVCQVYVWRSTNFGFNKQDRFTAFRAETEGRIAPLLPERQYKAKPLELGRKALTLFKDMEAKFDKTKRPKSLKEMLKE